MAWSDINFNTIVAGACTVDVNSTQNYNFVLNEFGKALDEKLNILIIAENPTLPDIRFFETGEIRAGDTFEQKYRDLLDGYFDIWNDYTWYSEGALTDPLNYTDYELDDTDLENAMGTNAYDLLINRDDKNRVELWSADLLNGLYELYNLTRVIDRGYQFKNAPTSTDPIRNRPTIFYGASELRYFTDGEGESGPSTSATYGSAKSDYNSNLIEQNLAGLQEAVVTRLNGNCLGTTDGDDEYGWELDLTMSRDSKRVFLKMTDLDDNLLEMDFYGTGAQLNDNFVIDTMNRYDKVPEELITPYNSNYPLVEELDPPIIVEFEPDNITQDPTKGTINQYLTFGSPTDQNPPTVADPADSSNGESDTTQLGIVTYDYEILMHSNFVIDINNAGLEFYIDP